MARFVLRFLAPAAVALALATPGVAAAQTSRGAWGGWSYEWGMPIGDLDEYIGNDSWVGFSLQGRTFVRERWAVGGFIGYNVFYENTNETIVLPRGALSGDQYRHLSAVPIMIGVYRHMLQGQRLYVGINGGVYYFYQMMDIGIMSISTNEWLWGFAPEAGLVLAARGRTAVALQARYHYPIPGGDGFLSGQERSFQFLSIGIAFFGRRGY